jgi:hypothetical protein
LLKRGEGCKLIPLFQLGAFGGDSFWRTSGCWLRNADPELLNLTLQYLEIEIQVGEPEEIFHGKKEDMNV